MVNRQEEKENEKTKGIHKKVKKKEKEEEEEEEKRVEIGERLGIITYVPWRVLFSQR